MAAKVPTMRDVAQLAGVSVQTVSCVINGTGSISEKTRNQVLHAVRQLDYRRDPIARSMRTKQTCLIGLLVLDITNPVLSVLASAVEQAANASNYNVILRNIATDARREQAYLEAAADRLVDGLVMVNSVDRARSFAFLEETRIPAVLIDCLAVPRIPSVSLDDFRGAYLATNHLIELGHRRIAHICGTRTMEVARQRELGYLQALSDKGIIYRHVEPPHSERWDYQAGYEAMQQLLRRDPIPTAVFAASDQMAIGAYRALAEAGLSVPGDVSIVGFDDIDAAAFAWPPLTTIHQPFAKMGAQAVSLLMRLLNGPAPETTHILLPPSLVIRQSTARI
jgi:LacI family transcriptional regulator